jgi:nucleotide-binding universal stress UspA family protein
MSSSILVPLDGSILAQRALPYAIALARSSARSMVLVRVLSPRPSRGEPLIQEHEASAVKLDRLLALSKQAFGVTGKRCLRMLLAHDR